MCPFLSEDYFALAASRPDVGAALALGPEVIIVVDGVAYRTVGAEQAGDPIRVPGPVAPDGAWSPTNQWNRRRRTPAAVLPARACRAPPERRARPMPGSLARSVDAPGRLSSAQGAPAEFLPRGA